MEILLFFWALFFVVITTVIMSMLGRLNCNLTKTKTLQSNIHTTLESIQSIKRNVDMLLKYVEMARAEKEKYRDELLTHEFETNKQDFLKKYSISFLEDESCAPEVRVRALEVLKDLGRDEAMGKAGKTDGA